MRSFRLHNLHLEWLEERTLLSVVSVAGTGDSDINSLPQNSVLSDHSFTVQKETVAGKTTYSIEGVDGGSLKIDTSAFRDANASFTISNFSQVYVTGAQSLDTLSLKDIGRVDVNVGVNRVLQADDVSDLSLANSAPPVMLLDGSSMTVSAGQFAKSAIISLVQNLALSSTTSSDLFSIVAGAANDNVSIDFSVKNLELYNFASLSQLSFYSRSLDPNLGPNPAAALDSANAYHPPSSSSSSNSGSSSSSSASGSSNHSSTQQGNQSFSISLSSLNGKVQDLTSLMPQLFLLASTQDNGFSAVLQDITAYSGPPDSVTTQASALAKGEPAAPEASITVRQSFQSTEAAAALMSVRRVETVEPAMSGTQVFDKHPAIQNAPPEIPLAVTFGSVAHEPLIVPKVATQSLMAKTLDSLRTVIVPMSLPGDKASAIDIQSVQSQPLPLTSPVAAFHAINQAMEKTVDAIDYSAAEFKVYLMSRVKQELTPGSGNILITDFMGANSRAPFVLDPES